jgi:hypothetical protein
MRNPATRSVPDVLGDIVRLVTTLLRQEVQLARAEMSDNLSTTATSLALVVVGAVLITPALVILLQAGVAALVDSNQLSPANAALIVGGAVLVLGLILLLVGVNRMKLRNMMPNRTIHQIQQDASVAKDQMRINHDIDRAA